MTRAWWGATLFLLGCGPDPLVEAASEWVGVYSLDQYQVDQGCGEPLEEQDPPYDFFQLDVRFGEEAHELNLRPCLDELDCVTAPWFQWQVEGFPEDQLEGRAGSYDFVGASGFGTCSLWWTHGRLKRTEGELRVEVQAQTLADVPVEDEDECARLLEDSVAEPSCASQFILQGDRVR